jgi:glycosyltransferase involved in cell wall biosynthesis
MSPELVAAPADVVFHTHETAWGGMEVHTDGLVRELVKRGLTVRLVQYNHDVYARQPGFPIGGDAVSQVRSSRPFRTLGHREAVGALRRNPGRLVIVPTAGLGWISLGFAAALKHERQAAVQIVHSMPFPRPVRSADLPPWRGRALWWHARAWKERTAARSFRRVFGVSESIVAALVGDYGIARSRAVAIPSGIDLDRFAPSAASRRQVRAAWGISDDVFVVGCVGRVHIEQKRVDQVVAAFAAARRAVFPRRLHMIVAGSGPDIPAVRDYATSIGALDDVSFLGHVNDVAPVLAGLDAFVLASPHEGLCLALAEAMSSGVPCLVCSSGGALELAHSDEVAWLAPVNEPYLMGDLLASLITNPAEAAMRAARAREHVARHFNATVQTGLLADALDV